MILNIFNQTFLPLPFKKFVLTFMIKCVLHTDIKEETLFGAIKPYIFLIFHSIKNALEASSNRFE